MYRGLFSSALASHWRREVLRTSLWFVPSLEVLAAIGLFIGTLAADRAAYRGEFGLPEELALLVERTVFQENALGRREASQRVTFVFQLRRQSGVDGKSHFS